MTGVFILQKEAILFYQHNEPIVLKYIYTKTSREKNINFYQCLLGTFHFPYCQPNMVLAKISSL